MGSPNQEVNLSYAIITRSPEATQRVGAFLGQLLQPKDALLLVGELGAGKTCLVQGIAQGLGVTVDVTSPTFVLMNEYPGRLMLYHIDLYRIEKTAEALDLGLDDYFYGEGACVVEWPDRAPAAMPVDYLEIVLQHESEEARRLTFRARGDRHSRLLRELYHTLLQAGVTLEESYGA